MLDCLPEHWSLWLLPSDPKMASMIQKISITGRLNDVRSIEFLQADGNRSVMTTEKIHKK